MNPQCISLIAPFTVILDQHAQVLAGNFQRAGRRWQIDFMGILLVEYPGFPLLRRHLRHGQRLAINGDLFAAENVAAGKKTRSTFRSFDFLVAGGVFPENARRHRTRRSAPLE